MEKKVNGRIIKTLKTNCYLNCVHTWPFCIVHGGISCVIRASQKILDYSLHDYRNVFVTMTRFGRVNLKWKIFRRTTRRRIFRSFKKHLHNKQNTLLQKYLHFKFLRFLYLNNGEKNFLQNYRLEKQSIGEEKRGETYCVLRSTVSVSGLGTTVYFFF